MQIVHIVFVFLVIVLASNVLLIECFERRILSIAMSCHVLRPSPSCSLACIFLDHHVNVPSNFWDPTFFTITTDNDPQLVVSFSGFSALPPSYFLGVPKFSPEHQQLPIAKVAFLGAAAHPGLVVAGRRRDFASTTIHRISWKKYWKIHHQWMLPARKIYRLNLGFAEDDLWFFFGNQLGKSMGFLLVSSY